MDIFRNKASGKYFIFLENMERGTALLITPKGEVKTLERHLFILEDSKDQWDLLSAGLITEIQVKRYVEYFSS